MEPAIELAPGAEDHGFAPMLATLLRQNLDDHADKRATALRMRGRVAMVITDLGMSVTLEFVPYAVRVHAGIVGIPDVTVRAPSEYIMKMSFDKKSMDNITVIVIAFQPEQYYFTS